MFDDKPQELNRRLLDSYSQIWRLHSLLYCRCTARKRGIWPMLWVFCASDVLHIRELCHKRFKMYHQTFIPPCSSTQLVFSY